MVSPFDTAHIARRLVAAHKGAAAVPQADVLPPDRETAHAVQDATVAALDAVGGWKVGAKGPAMEPGCAPLPARGIVASGAALLGPPWRMRGIEVEVAVRLGRDLVPTSGEPDAATVRAAIDAVLPAIEVVETRLADWRDSDPLAQLADLQSHGGLILGAPSAIALDELDLRAVQAYLAFDGQPVASTRGANPAGDIWRLLGWLAWHCAQRGQPLRAGQVVTTGSCTGMLFAQLADLQSHGGLILGAPSAIALDELDLRAMPGQPLRAGQVVTTGSCTGMLFAPEGAHVQAQLDGIGRVELQF